MDEKTVSFLAHLPLGVVLAAGGLVLGLSEEPSAHTAGSMAIGSISRPVSIDVPAIAWNGLDAQRDLPQDGLSAAASAALMRVQAASITGSAADMALGLPVAALPVDDADTSDDLLSRLATIDSPSAALNGSLDLPADLMITELIRQDAVRRQRQSFSGASGDAINAPSDLVSVKGQDQKRRQARLGKWLSRYYARSPDDVARYIRYAWESGARNGVDPLLIIAVMSIESSLNPNALSHKGARGLMQVLVRAHEEKFGPFGGPDKANHPRVSIEVGSRILARMIEITGSVDGALKHYVGARYFKTDGGYGAKVISMRERVWAASMGYEIPVRPDVRAATEHANNAQAAFAAHTRTAQR